MSKAEVFLCQGVEEVLYFEFSRMSYSFVEFDVGGFIDTDVFKSLHIYPLIEKPFRECHAVFMLEHPVDVLF